MTRFCVDCAGPSGEHVPVLVAKREEERRARRRERNLLKPNYQAHQIRRAARLNRYISRDPDPLMTNLANDGISGLFEEVQQQENLGEVQDRHSDHLPSAVSTVHISDVSGATETPGQLVAAANDMNRTSEDIFLKSCRHSMIGEESTPEHIRPSSQRRRQSWWKLPNILQSPCAVLERKIRKRYLRWKIFRKS